MNLFIAFITGASSGALGCLATQAGLLTHLLVVRPESGPVKTHTTRPAAWPIGLFLMAKLVAYTTLGGLLGAFGSVLHLSPSVQAGLLIAIGLFMVANGLRLLNLHPVFRYVAIGPPAFLRRFIRRRSAMDQGWTTPLVLGILTVLLPCGVAQAMMATALGSGTPGRGALILFAFTLGSTPAFFAVTYLATRLSTSLMRRSTPLVALLLMGLGLIPLNQGLTLAGSPVSYSRLMDRLSGPGYAPKAQPFSKGVIQVSDEGYAPKLLHMKAGQASILTWVTEGTDSCARTVVMHKMNYQVTLPSHGRVLLTIPPQTQGTVLEYSCSMGMYEGRIVFDQE